VPNDAARRDGAVVGDLSDVLKQQARPELREREHRIDGASWDSQRVLSRVDATGSPELEEVRGEHLAHAAAVEACLRAPEPSLEMLEYVGILLAQFHV
jgi:hypothetical protein